MKHKLIILAALAMCSVSCYEDYVRDYDVVACGFANPTDVRSVIIGESTGFSTGIALGGVMENQQDREVSFAVDYSLVNANTLSLFKNHKFTYIQNLMKNVSSLKALPAEVYTLETESGAPGRAVIKAGTHLGVINVQLDMDKFLAADHLVPDSVIPLRITDGHGTDIIDGFNTTTIGVRFENMLFGTYYHGGMMEVEEGGVITGTRTYYTTVPQADNKVWTLTTAASDALTVNAVGSENNGADAQMRLILKGDDSIVIESVADAKYSVQPDGESYFKRSKLLQDRKIILNYKYEDSGVVYHAHDTLTFRNRVRDGVNEWQDENQKNYE